MTDDEPGTRLGVSRRALLGAVTAGSVAMAGCGGGGFSCDVGIDKTTQGTFQYGSQGTYEITVFNDTVMFGTCSGEIVIEDDLPPGITFDSVSGNWTANVVNGVLTATNDSYGSLGPQSSITLEVTVNIATAGAFPVSLPIENCATGTIGGDSIYPVNNCVIHEFEGQATPTATKTEAPTDTPTPTESQTPTESPTRTPSDTETPRPTPTETDTQRPTATETATDTPTPTATETPNPEPTATPKPTATPTDTPTDRPTSTETPSDSTPTETPTRERR